MNEWLAQHPDIVAENTHAIAQPNVGWGHLAIAVWYTEKLSLMVEMGGKGARMRSRSVPLVAVPLLAFALVGCSESST